MDLTKYVAGAGLGFLVLNHEKVVPVAQEAGRELMSNPHVSGIVYGLGALYALGAMSATAEAVRNKMVAGMPDVDASRADAPHIEF